jgi:hypothetical protein
MSLQYQPPPARPRAGTSPRLPAAAAAAAAAAPQPREGVDQDESPQEPTTEDGRDGASAADGTSRRVLENSGHLVRWHKPGGSNKEARYFAIITAELKDYISEVRDGGDTIGARRKADPEGRPIFGARLAARLMRETPYKWVGFPERKGKGEESEGFKNALRLISL